MKKYKLLLGVGLIALILTGCTTGGTSSGGDTEPGGNPIHEHAWGNPTYTWADDYSSCTAERICETNSTHKETETAVSIYTIVEPSHCDSNGTGRYTVSFQNSAFSTQTHDVSIDETGHQWSNPTYRWTDDYSSCTAERVCSNDSSHIEIEVSTSDYEVIDEADCENNGLGRYTASFQNSAFLTQTHDVQIDSIGHQWGDIFYTWSSSYDSCTAERACLNDLEHKQSETVNSTYSIITQASCESDGIGRYTASFQNSAFSTQTHDIILDKTGHQWETPVYVWSDDNTTCIASRRCVNNPDHIETENGYVEFHITQYPTIENEGSGQYTALFLNDAFENQIKIVEIEGEYIGTHYLSFTLSDNEQEYYVAQCFWDWSVFNSIEEICIPAEYEGKPVTKLLSSSLSHLPNLKRVFVSNNVKEIEPFVSSYNIEEYIVDSNNQNFTDVDGIVFSSDLTKLIVVPNDFDGDYIIPSTVVEICNGAFYCTHKIGSVTFGNNVKTVGEEAFAHSKLTSATLNVGCESINDRAFCDCSELETINIPSTITHLGVGVFDCNITSDGCYSDNAGNLKTFIYDAVDCEIKDSIFDGQPVREIIIGDNCEVVPDVIALGGIKTLSFVIGANVSSIKWERITSNYHIVEIVDNRSGENNLIYNQYFLKSLAEDVIFVPYGGERGIFNSINNVFEVYQKGSITILFDYVGDEESITIPNEVTHINNMCFNGKEDIVEINTGDEVLYIGMNSFRNMLDLESITIGKSVNRIADSNSLLDPSDYSAPYGVHLFVPTFGGSLKIKEINVDIENEYFKTENGLLLDYNKQYCYYGLPTLTEVAIPNTVCEIARYAFEYSSLEEVTIPEGVIALHGAFGNCESLKTVRFPSSLIWLNEPFYGCPALEFVYYGGTIEQWKSLSKSSNWESNQTVSVIHCSGGDLNL